MTHWDLSNLEIDLSGKTFDVSLIDFNNWSDFLFVESVYEGNISRRYISSNTSDSIADSGNGPVDISWIFLSARSNDQNGEGLIGKVIDGVNVLIAGRNFKAIDRALEMVPTASASRLVLITLARATFPVRPKLKAWTSFVEKVSQSFEERGLDAQRLLKGLI